MPVTHRTKTLEVPVELDKAITTLQPEWAAQSGETSVDAFWLWLLEAAIRSYGASVVQKKQQEALQQRRVFSPEEWVQLEKANRVAPAPPPPGARRIM